MLPQRPATPESARRLAGRHLIFDGAEFELGRKLGAGRFATVYHADRRRVDSPACAGAHLPTQLAIKVCELAGISAWGRMALVREQALWMKVDHPNVARCLGAIKTPTQAVILLEECQGGELFERIMKMNHFSEDRAARLTAELCSAVSHLHSCGIAHRDLKPENILLASDADDAPLKLADFGAAGLVHEGLRTPCGSLGYAAPEQLRGLFSQKRDRSGAPAAGSTYGYEVDAWAVGVIVYILLTGVMPFDPARYREAPLTVAFPDDLFGGVSAAAIDFIERLLCLSSSHRMTVQQAEQHTWLQLASQDTATASTGVIVATCTVEGPAPAAELKEPAPPTPPTKLLERRSLPEVSFGVCEGKAAGPAAVPLHQSDSLASDASHATAASAALGEAARGMEPAVTNPGRPAPGLPTPSKLRTLKESGALERQWQFNVPPRLLEGDAQDAHVPVPRVGRWGSFEVEASEKGLPAGGESAAVAGIIAAHCEYVPLGSADGGVDLQLPARVRQQL